LGIDLDALATSISYKNAEDKVIHLPKLPLNLHLPAHQDLTKIWRGYIEHRHLQLEAICIHFTRGGLRSAQQKQHRLNSLREQQISLMHDAMLTMNTTASMLSPLVGNILQVLSITRECLCLLSHMLQS
jgi:hypothetical protein